MATLTSIKALITALRQATARRSVSPENVGYIMQLLAEHIGDSESAQQLLREGITSLRADLDALDHDNATGAIESFREILAFLDGCKDDETLLAKLTEIKALITAEAADRQSAIADALNTAQVADAELQEQIAEHRRELHYLPDNFATEKALFTAAGTYTIGTQPIKPGALLLGCVDEVWAVYQYVYFYDEVEISAQSDEGVQAAAASAPTIAPPAVKHDANVANPENWVRLPDISDMAEEAAARKEVDARLEQSCIKVSADTTLAIADAADTAVQEWVPAESRTTCAAMLTALAADGGYFEGGLPMLVARNTDGTIAEMMVYNAENTGGDVFYDITNYVPLSLATLAATRQPRLSSSTDILVGMDAKLTLTEEAKHAVFDDLWKAAGCTIGTGESKYLCNGIGHTYEEAKYLYDMGCLRHGCLDQFYRDSAIKTNMPPKLNGNIGKGSYTFMGCTQLTNVVAPLYFPNIASFRGCTALHTIKIYAPNSDQGNAPDAYLNCSALTTIDFTVVFAHDFDLSYSPLLDLATFQRIVSKYNKGTAITIYVHPDVYAKLTDPDHIDNAQWYAAMTQAVNKKIAFATKE